MIETKRYANGETQSPVVTRTSNPKNVIECFAGAVQAVSQPILKIDKSDGVVLPCHFRSEPHVVAASISVDELKVADIKTQVR